MFEVIGGHEAIIDETTFDLVQTEMARRKTKNECYQERRFTSGNESFFNSILVCDKCGKLYRRKKNCGNHIWLCSTYHDYGKSYCDAKRIRDDLLRELVEEELDVESLSEVNLYEIFTEIRLNSDSRTIELRYTDGTINTIKWRERSRSESWTEEMREKARVQTAERHRRNKNGNCKKN